MVWRWEPRQQARRLIAREQGFVQKDWGGRLPVALVYPNRYAVGMANLGMHLIYRLLNARSDVVCERAFATLYGRHGPRGNALWVGQDLRLKGVGPILSLESQRPLADFSLVAFSVPYELDYPHVLEMLRVSGIPLQHREREAEDPLVIAGGMALSANPEPMAMFLDAVVIGEAEPVLPSLLKAVQEIQGAPREEAWDRLAYIPGVYVPALYSISYGADGRMSHHSFAGHTWQEDEEMEGALPGSVVRQFQPDLDQEPTCTTIFSSQAEFGDLYLLEVSRGCGRGCAFCLTGFAARPARFRSAGSLLTAARDGLRFRHSVGLMGAAVSDHPEINEIVRALRELNARISVSSWRADALSEPLLRGLAESGARSITLAPEAATEKLRRRIAKPIREDHLERAARLAGSLGIRQIKLYFMIGLPGETVEDVSAIGELASRIASWSGARVVAGVSPFVPKAQTPFQRLPMLEPKEMRRRLSCLRKDLPKRGIQVRHESVPWSEVQAILARGDRELGQALLTMEQYTLGDWRASLEQAGLEVAPAAQGVRKGRLPWGHIVSGVTEVGGGACAG